VTVVRGDVRWGPAPHKSSPAYRPWLVVSDDTHPFAGEECLAVAQTTTDHDDSITLPDDGWALGGSDVQSFASPWYLTTIKTRTFDRHQGRLDPSLVSQIAELVHGYVPV